MSPQRAIKNFFTLEQNFYILLKFDSCGLNINHNTQK